MRAFCHLALLPDYHYAEQAHFERDGLVCFAFDDLPVIAEGFSKHMSEAWEQMEDPFFSYLKMPLGKPATAAAAAEVESESPKDTAKRACSCIEKHWAANHKDALIHFRLNMRIKQVLLSDLLQSLLYASWRSCPIALKVFYDCYCQFDFTQLTAAIYGIFSACINLVHKKSLRSNRVDRNATTASRAMEALGTMQKAFFKFDWSKLFYSHVHGAANWEETKVLRIYHATNQFFATGLWWPDRFPALEGIELGENFALQEAGDEQKAPSSRKQCRKTDCRPRND